MSIRKESAPELKSDTVDRYILLLNTLKHGVQVNDCKGVITYSNKAHHQMLGYEYGEITGKEIWDLLPTAPERASLKKYFKQLLKKKSPSVPYITRSIKKDGSIVDLQIDWNYELDDRGKITGFISVITDITDRIQTEESLRLRTQDLATLLEVSKRLGASLDLKNVLQATVDGVIKLVGLDTAAVYLLEGETLYLWATSPPLPTNFPDNLRIAPLAEHPHIRHAISSREHFYVQDITKESLTQAERMATEQRNLRTLLYVPLIVDAKTIGAFIVGSANNTCPISDAEIDLSRTLANLAALAVRNAQLYKDGQKYAAQLEQTLVERIRVEEEQKNLQSQLVQAQKMESVGRLAGGVAHDFNNMLSVIVGHAELALGQLDPSHSVFSDLKQIHKAAQRSTNLTHQLLAFASRQTVIPKLLDLNDVISEMLKMLRRLIGEDINLIWTPGADLGLVKMDPVQMDQILANLCVNARDAISGVGKITIATSNAVFDESYCAANPEFLPGKYILIRVSDNGCGIDEDIQGSIFEPFFSTKKEQKGTGLGLSTVYGIVKQNKGFITIDSTPGQGATFNIYLARHEADEGKVHVEKVISAPRTGSETILLVEDEIMILNIGRRMLESLGYTVLAANDPADAIFHAREFKGSIDLLITDVVMPSMNGPDLARQIKAIIPSVKILYISGYAADVISTHGILRHGVMFLSKPFSKEELAIKVHETIMKDKNKQE